MAEAYKADRKREEEANIYTDDLEADSVDIIERYENNIRRQTDFIKNNISNIGSKDSVNEMLFKMIEQVKHVNTKLADFLTSETQMNKAIKQFQDLPAIIKSFEEIPEKLEG